MVFIGGLITGLVTFIGSVLGQLVAFFAVYLTKRVALVLAAVSMLLLLTAAFFVAISALIAGVSVASPNFSIAASWILPGNIDECVSVYMAGRFLRFVYDVKSHGIQMRLL